MEATNPSIGVLGLMPDQPDHMLPLGGWKDGRNIRFNDGYMERIKEPAEILALPVGAVGEWQQRYVDETGPRVVICVTEGGVAKLYRLSIDLLTWEDVTPAGGLTSGGTWTSFAWGTACVVNNGIEAPQILLSGATEFVTLTGWGLTTGGQKVVTAAVLRPFRGFMWAFNLVVDGAIKPNAVWISGPGVEDNDDSLFFQPSWDYEDPGSSSVFTYVGSESGPIVDALELNNQLVIYTSGDARIASLVGGANIWDFQPSVEYGLIGIGSVVAFKNFHFCIGPSTIYLHDGSVVTPVGDAVIQNHFYNSLSDLDDITGAENLAFKEVHMMYNTNAGREYLVYNYKDKNFSIGNAAVADDPVSCMAYDLDAGDAGAETYGTVTTTYATETRTYADLAGRAKRRAMFWLTGSSYYRAESLASSDPSKRYYVTRDKLDFSELDPQLTMHWWKEVEEASPHITGTATTSFTFGWSEVLGSGVKNKDPFIYNPSTDYKINPRVSGRYIAMEVEIVSDGDWKMSSMDYDLTVDYGR